MLAQADSSGAQYTDAPPTVTGGKAPSDHDPPARSSTTNSGGASAPADDSGSEDSDASGSGSAAGGSSSGSGGGSGAAGDGGTGKQGSPGQGSGNGDGSAGTTKPSGGVDLTTAEGDDGGSSPLVPILIAVLVLAAISLGAVMVKQRRRRGTPGSSVSPEAS